MNLGRIRKYLDESSAHVAVRALVLFRLSYCMALPHDVFLCKRENIELVVLIIFVLYLYAISIVLYVLILWALCTFYKKALCKYWLLVHLIVRNLRSHVTSIPDQYDLQHLLVHVLVTERVYPGEQMNVQTEPGSDWYVQLSSIRLGRSSNSEVSWQVLSAGWNKFKSVINSKVSKWS